MASVTRVHGSDSAVGTLYSPNANCFLITVKTAAPANVDLQTQDTYGGNAQIDGVLESIIKELNPKAWYAPADNSGQIHVVMDKNIDDATELRTRIRNMSPINSIVVTGTTVVAASSITIA